MYDLIIIGGGPAGLSAAIYAARYKLKTLILTKIIGGEIIEAHLVENYPGTKAASGMEMMNDWKEQALNLGTEIKERYEVKEITKQEDHFLVNNEYKAKAILLTTGTQRRKLDVKGEENFIGKGVSYCATCDSAFFKDKTVAVIGGSDSAVLAALLLTQYAKKVYIIYRKDRLRAEPIRTEKAENNPKIEIIYNANVTEIKGKDFVQSVKLDNSNELKLDGIFIEIGSVPSTALAKELNLELDENNCIIVDKSQKTSEDKVYAAGDITTNCNGFRQVITAAAEGAIAAHSIYNDLKTS